MAANFSVYTQSYSRYPRIPRASPPDSEHLHFKERSMKHHFTWPILILLLALTGCAHHRTTDEHAKAFFEDGRSYILKSLKKQDASQEQLDSAKAILDRREPEEP